MSTVVTGRAEDVFLVIRNIFLRSAERGKLSMVITFSNACPI